MMRRLAAFALVAAFAVLPAAVRAADPVQINVIVPETGPASFLGKEEVQALQVIEATVNKSGGIAGRPVQFVIQDDASNPQTGVQLLNGVLAKKVPVVLGSSLVAVCSAMTPLFKDGPFDYCFSPGIHPPKGSYVFSSSISTTELLQASARYFSARGWKRVAIITSTDATGQDAERTIDAAFSATPGEAIVAREYFNTTDVSVAAQMARIKASNAQALITWSTGTPVATLLRGVAEAGINLPVMTGDGNQTYAQMKAYASFLPKELYFAGPPCLAPNQLPKGPVKAAVDAYQAAFKAAGIKPDIGQSLAWDPALIVIDALKKLGPEATGTQVRDYVNGLKSWAGVSGRYDFSAMPQRGLGLDSAIIERWDPSGETWVGVSKPGGAPL